MMKPLNKWTSADIIGFVKGVDKKTWVALLSWTVAGLLVFVFLLFPAWIERPMLRKEMETMEAQIRQVNALSQKRRVWEENQKVFGELIVETQGRAFTSEEAGLLLGQVSKMASESRVDVLASKPLVEKTVFPAPHHTKYQPRGYEFSVQGSYHDLGKFASLIEGHEKLLRIRSLQIESTEKDPTRHTAELKLWAILAPSTPATPPTGAQRAKK